MKIIAKNLDALRALTSELDEHGISYTMEDMSDNTFPSLNQQESQALFIIHEALSDSVYESIKQIPGLDIESWNQGKGQGRKRIVKNLIWAYAIVVTIMLVKYWHIERVNSVQKNFDSHWNWNNTALTFTDKKTGERVYTYYDQNFDFNYERTIEYLNPEGSNAAYFDKNEDGYFEIVDYYSSKGEYIGTIRDYDFDKIYDELEIILESGDTVRFYDENKNGTYDKIWKSQPIAKD